uniref:Adenosine deaminase n=1 Tax=Timema californicum TaxID=61474 RepID=A0A7R9J7C6_TIMCA|nr:unnamed protein product [Timema californicum]
MAKEFIMLATGHPQSAQFGSIFANMALLRADTLGDLDSIERVAYEFCEDEARNGVIYVEARYSPHFLLPSDVPKTYEALCEVIKAVNRGFKRGENDFKVKARQIICALVGANMIRDVIRLCEQFRDEGVVGLDTAAMSTSDLSEYEEVSLGVDEVLVYQEASRLGIHRTVHAGEIGSAEMVKRAVEEYNSERIGHGYNVLSDPAVYDMCRKKDIHFETCPWSSLLTGAVPLGVNKHPIVRFAEDNINFSLSSDDPTVTGCFVEGDYRLTASWGLSEAHFVRCGFRCTPFASLSPSALDLASVTAG